MGEYPRINDHGDTVWACCESAIGPPCRHQGGDRDERER